MIPPPDDSGSKTRPVRVCTFNIHGLREHAPGGPVPAGARVPGVEELADLLAELDADVIAVQEGLPVETMQIIARRLDMSLANFPSPVRWPGHLLSRFTIVRSLVFSHFDPRALEPALTRSAGAALLELDPDRRLWTVSVHLHPKSADMRQREAEVLTDELRPLVQETDAIVMGDFNCEPPESMHTALLQLGFAATVPDGQRLVTHGDRATDYIYVSGALQKTATAARMASGPGFSSEHGPTVVSDHLPVVAELIV
jgi:endonuclease/exonuclease/phosphatase family metal-dependent hydrolase